MEKTVEILYEKIKRETDKAWLLVIEGDEYWLPKSQCDVDEEHQAITIPEWLAIEKDLIDY